MTRAELAEDLELRARGCVDLAAEPAFWEAVAAEFPTASAGDFPIDATHTVREQMKAAIVLWAKVNVPEYQDLL